MLVFYTRARRAMAPATAYAMGLLVGAAAPAEVICSGAELVGVTEVVTGARVVVALTVTGVVVKRVLLRVMVTPAWMVTHSVTGIDVPRVTGTITVP